MAMAFTHRRNRCLWSRSSPSRLPCGHLGHGRQPVNAPLEP